MSASGSKISRGFAAASSGILGSRVSGLVRDMVFGAFWGTSDALGAFLVAFTVPNLVRSLLGEGALSEGFVPLFNERLAKGGKASAFAILCNVLSVVSLLLAALVVVGVIGCVIASMLLEPGLARLTLRLAAALLPYTFFICLVGFLTGVLNSFGRFSLPFLAPVILNVMFIVATMWLAPLIGTEQRVQIFALVIGVMLAGILQLLAMGWLLHRQGFRFRFVPRWRSEGMHELWALVLPACFGAAIYQVNVLCDRVVAGWLGGYAVTSLYYSERLIFLPIGIFAVALSAACLPVMSRASAEADVSGMVSALLYAVRHILFLTLPCVLIFMLLGREVIALIFERGSFTSESTEHTLAALLFYAPGIPAFAAAKILRAGFFSRKNTRSPVRIAALCMVLNLILNLALMGPLQQRGLALATVASAWLNVILLTLIFFRSVQTPALDLARLVKSLLRQALALCVMGVAVWSSRTWLVDHVEPGLLGQILHVAVPAGVGGAAFLAVAWWSGSDECRELRALFARKLSKGGAGDTV